jgi:hypothetical protein
MSEAIGEIRADVSRLEARADAHDRRLEVVEDRIQHIGTMVDKIWSFRVVILVGMALLGGGEEGLKLLRELWR